MFGLTRRRPTTLSSSLQSLEGSRMTFLPCFCPGREVHPAVAAEGLREDHRRQARRPRSSSWPASGASPPWPQRWNISTASASASFGSTFSTSVSGTMSPPMNLTSPSLVLEVGQVAVELVDLVGRPGEIDPAGAADVDLVDLHRRHLRRPVRLLALGRRQLRAQQHRPRSRRTDAQKLSSIHLLTHGRHSLPCGDRDVPSSPALVGNVTRPVNRRHTRHYSGTAAALDFQHFPAFRD